MNPKIVGVISKASGCTALYPTTCAYIEDALDWIYAIGEFEHSSCFHSLWETLPNELTNKSISL